jgi:hypothetical protein
MPVGFNKTPSSPRKRKYSGVRDKTLVIPAKAEIQCVRDKTLVIPAKAGIHVDLQDPMDSRLRGNDERALVRE